MGRLHMDVRFTDTIEGWLLPEAAHLTIGLMRIQDSHNVNGAVLEIGVWRGKYLSVLYHASKGRVFGIDIFEWGNTEAEVGANFARVFGERSRLTLLRANSKDLTPAQIADFAGEGLRFISIDGAHTPDAVCHDIGLAAALLVDHGIIALDDFLNSRAIGVSEGAYRYFIEHNRGRLTPFAYCGNKLFIARREAADFYSDATLQFLSENGDLPVSRTFAEFAARGDAWVKQELLGRKCLILS
jgi:hypothetical protein